MDILRFLAAQDQQEKQQLQQQDTSSETGADDQQQQEKKKKEMKPFTVEDFTNTYSAIAPIFSKEMCVNVIIESSDEIAGMTSSSNNNNNSLTTVVTEKPKSLADQIREEEAMKKQNQQNIIDNSSNNNSSGETEKKKEEEKNEKQTSTKTTTEPVPATKNDESSAFKNFNIVNASDPSLNEKMKVRAAGYAPRGRGGRGGGRGGRGNSNNNNDNNNSSSLSEEENSSTQNNNNKPKKEVIEVFAPTIQSDFKKSIKVDNKMPFQSDRSFHNLMHCVVTAILLRDRPSSFSSSSASCYLEIQEVAEKAIAYHVVDRAWKYASASFEKEQQQQQTEKDNSFTLFDVKHISENFFSTFRNEEQEGEQESCQVVAEKVIKFVLEPLHFLLTPLRFSEKLFSSENQWLMLTKIHQDDDNNNNNNNENDSSSAAAAKKNQKSGGGTQHFCSCDKIAGRLENLRWQLIRKTIDALSEFSSTSTNNNNNTFFHKALRNVLEHWNPLSLLKKQFPHIYKNWFLDFDIKKIESFIITDSKQEEKLVSSCSNEEETISTTDNGVAPLTLFFAQIVHIISVCHVEKNINSVPEFPEYVLLNSLAKDVLIFRKNGLPFDENERKIKQQQQQNQEEEEKQVSAGASASAEKMEVQEQQQQQHVDPKKTLDVEQETTTTTNIENDIELCGVILKWWGILLREQCSVCCQKVYF